MKLMKSTWFLYGMMVILVVELLTIYVAFNCEFDKLSQHIDRCYQKLSDTMDRTIDRNASMFGRTQH